MKNVIAISFPALLSLIVSVWPFEQAAALETPEAFLRQSASSSRAQVRLAALALQNSSNASVRNLAEVMLSDQSELLADVRQTAGRSGLSLERGISADQSNNLNALSGLSGAEFDRAYLSLLELSLLVDSRRYAEQAAAGRSRRVRNFADDSLSRIEQDLSLVRTVQSDFIPTTGQGTPAPGTTTSGDGVGASTDSEGVGGSVCVCPGSTSGTGGTADTTSTGTTSTATGSSVTNPSLGGEASTVTSVTSSSSSDAQIPSLPPLGTASGNLSSTVPTSSSQVLSPAGTVAGQSGGEVNTVPGGILSDPTVSGLQTDFHPGGILSHDLVQQ